MKNLNRVSRNASLARIMATTALVLVPATAWGQEAQTDTAEANDGQIIVTAQRRSERLVDVPIAITAVDGEKLQSAGVSATNQLTQVVPAFRVDYGGGFAQPSIRGVGTAVSNVGGGAAVGVYVDGFYNASPLSADFDFLNVSNIQVVKGPQGTLFGRNTTGGAVIVSTADPQEEFALKAKAGYSRFNTFDAGAYITGGSNGLSFDFGGQYKRTDSWYTNVVNGDDKFAKGKAYSIRTGIKYEFGGDNSIMFRFAHSKRDAPEVLMLGVYKDDQGRFETIGVPYNNFVDAGIFPAPKAVWGTNNRTVATDPGYQPYFTSKVTSYQLSGKFDLGFANLTSYSQYRREFDFSALEVDDTQLPFFSVSFHNKDVLKTQEFLLNSKPGGRLQWVAGLFYMDQTAGQTDFSVDVPALGKAYLTYMNIKSYAAFADATYQATDKIFLTVGGRYSSETDNGHWELFAAGPLIGTPPRQDLHRTFKNFSPRAVIRYEVSPSSNVYASVTRGFKAGLVNVNGFTAAPINSEHITSYEAGFKTSSPTTRFEISSFYYDYKDLQVSSYNGTLSITTNAATSKVYGGEIFLAQKVGDHLTLSGGVAYTHARYKKYLTAPANQYLFTPGNVPTPVGSLNPANLSVTYGTLNNAPSDVSGNHLIRSPDWSGNVSADYETPMMGGTLALNANYSFQSTIYFDPANNNKQKSYGLLNLRAGWTDPTDHYTISVWGNNVTDTSYYNQILPNGLATGVTYGSPATYGVMFNVKF